MALLQAARSGDSAAIRTAGDAWYADADEIADFLHAANKRNWPRAEMRAVMKVHLGPDGQGGDRRLQRRFAADIRYCEAVHRHILEMADMLSDGIIREFPGKFR